MKSITFTLPQPFPLLNHSIGQSRFVLTGMRRKMVRSVAQAALHLRPAAPFVKASVRIERYSTGTPDRDGLFGGAKFLVDALTTPRPLNVRTPGARPRVKNKRGLGFVVDDSPECILLEVVSVKSRRADQRTVVTITEVVG